MANRNERQPGRTELVRVTVPLEKLRLYPMRAIGEPQSLRSTWSNGAVVANRKDSAMGTGYQIKVSPEIEADEIIEMIKVALVDKGVQFAGKDDINWVLIAALEVLSGTPPKKVWENAMGAKSTLSANTRTQRGHIDHMMTMQLNAMEREVWEHATRDFPRKDYGETLIALQTAAIRQYEEKGFNRTHALRELHSKMPNLFRDVPR